MRWEGTKCPQCGCQAELEFSGCPMCGYREEEPEYWREPQPEDYDEEE